MIDDYLKVIYDDYYNINRTLDLPCDTDVMKFTYFILQGEYKEKNITDIVKEYKSMQHKDIDELLNDFSNDPLFSMKNTLHFTYPFQATFRRLDVLYEMTGKDLWKKIFGYSFEELYTVITVILCRIILFYNMYRQIKDPTEKKDFEDNNPLIRDCYFTKNEIYKYFNGHEKEIDAILNDISIIATDIKEIKDIYKVINNNGHYYLIFIWDFLYYLYSVYSKKIKEYMGNIKFNDSRGKSFENVCFKNLEKYFPNAKKYQSLQYFYNNGNHEIDILLELEKVVVVFECKSGAFDVYDFDTADELYSNFRKVYGNGYKTINDLNKYLENGNNTFKTKDDSIINVDLTNKKIIYKFKLIQH